MSYFTVENSKFLFSTTFGTAYAVSAISNNDPAVAVVAAGHNFVNSDELLFNSGWEDAADTLWKASSVGPTAATFVGLDTGDTQWYPAGAGIGTLQKVSNWVEIGQVLDVQPSGGGARKMNIDPLSKRNGIVMPTGFEASGVDLTIGYDPSLAAQVQLNKVSRNLSQKVAFKFLLSGGQSGLGYGYAQISQMPGMAKGKPLDLKLSISFLGRFNGYAT